VIDGVELTAHPVRTGPGPPRGGEEVLSILSVSHRKSVLYGAFGWARRALNG
jgi:hypothetical protein